MKDLETQIKILKEENNELKNQITSLQNNINIVGWKGKGSLDIKPLGKDEFIITETRKSKHTGTLHTNKHIINRKQVNMVLSVIRGTSEKGTRKTSYGEVVSELCSILSLRLSPSSFFGRRKTYFGIYYYPVKIIESKGIIKYGGRGTIELLDKKIRSV